MPPNRYSRHRFTTRYADPVDGKLSLSEREPYAYRELIDNRIHVVQEGDTLWTLAGQFFEGMPRASGFWWVIADFQPEPIFDPTVALEVGSMLYIPSLRTLQEQILNDRRRGEEPIE